MALPLCASIARAQLFGDKPAAAPNPTPYFDLDFEREGTMRPWEMIPTDCLYDLDRAEHTHGKQSLSIAFGHPDAQYDPSIGATVTQILPLGVAGLDHWKLEIKVDIKCDAITKGAANFYAAILRDSSKTIEYRNLMSDSIKGTKAWKTYSLLMDCDTNVHYLQLACMLGGTGKVWFDHVQILVNGTSIPELALPITPSMTTAERTALTKKLVAFDPNGSSDDPRLAALDPCIGDHRVIALGEATNGTHEFFAAKTKLIRYLVEHKGFTHVGFEGNTAEMDYLNDYIATGKGNLDSLLKGFYYWPYISQEVRDLITWMRQYNASGKHVELFGFDMQSPYKIHDEIVRFAREQKLPHADNAVHAADRFLAVLDNIEKGGTTPIDSFKTYSDNLYHVLEGDALKVRASEQLHFRTILIYADNLRQFASLVTASIAPQQVRDSSMATNVVNRMLLADASAKCVLWTHNFHAGKFAHTMGAFLKKEYGESYLAIGFAFDGGRYNAGVDGMPTVCDALPAYPGSFEQLCKEISPGPFFLDLRGKPEVSGLPKAFYGGLDHHNVTLNNERFSFYEAVIPQVYDAIIYIPQSTPSKLLNLK
ncbi:MAG: erythromycin esterase family protein [Bacteroidetes bacterium]|nr:erythromycin esterase family protein [Bacteroidota bacterium]